MFDILHQLGPETQGTTENSVPRIGATEETKFKNTREDSAGLWLSCLQLFEWCAIHQINHYPVDNSVGFASIIFYPLDSDLSTG